MKENQVVFPYTETPFIPITFPDFMCKAMVDSGATGNHIRRATLNKIGEGLIALGNDLVDVKMADGAFMARGEQAEISFHIGQFQFLEQFIIDDALIYPIIIGRDFINKYNLANDPQNKRTILFCKGFIVTSSEREALSPGECTPVECKPDVAASLMRVWSDQSIEIDSVNNDMIRNKRLTNVKLQPHTLISMNRQYNELLLTTPAIIPIVNKSITFNINNKKPFGGPNNKI